MISAGGIVEAALVVIATGALTVIGIVFFADELAWRRLLKRIADKREVDRMIAESENPHHGRRL